MTTFFERLNGSWLFNRQVNNHLTHQQSTATGQALFSPLNDINELLYNETGEWVTEALPHRFHQQYIYQFKQPSSIDIFFVKKTLINDSTKGEFFHSINIKDKNDTFVHLCGKDKYSGQFEMISEASFLLSWHVKGPRKDYELTTVFQRDEMFSQSAT